MKKLNNTIIALILMINANSLLAWSVPSPKNITLGNTWNIFRTAAKKAAHTPDYLGSYINNNALKGIAASWIAIEQIHNLINDHYKNKNDSDSVPEIYKDKFQLENLYTSLRLKIIKNEAIEYPSLKAYARKALNIYDKYSPVLPDLLRLINPAYWAYHSVKQYQAIRYLKNATDSKQNELEKLRITPNGVANAIYYLAHYWARSMTDAISHLITNKGFKYYTDNARTWLNQRFKKHINSARTKLNESFKEHINSARNRLYNFF